MPHPPRPSGNAPRNRPAGARPRRAAKLTASLICRSSPAPARRASAAPPTHRGTGTSSSAARIAPIGVARSSSASGVSTSRCRSTGAAMRATSSGVTYDAAGQPRGGLRRAQQVHGRARARAQRRRYGQLAGAADDGDDVADDLVADLGGVDLVARRAQVLGARHRLDVVEPDRARARGGASRSIARSSSASG